MSRGSPAEGIALLTAAVASFLTPFMSASLNIALREARLTGFGDLIPIVFSVFARWHAQADDAQKTVVLATFAANMKTAWHETKEYTGGTIELATENLTPETALQAQEQGLAIVYPPPFSQLSAQIDNLCWR